MFGRKRRAEETQNAPMGALAVTGDLHVSGSATFPTGLVTQGDLTLEPDARLEGDVIVGGTLTLGPGATITGNATVSGKVVAASDASIGGRLACQRLLLRAGKTPVKQAKSEAEVVATRPA